MIVKSLRTSWRSEILSNRTDSIFYSLVGVWSSLIALSPHENLTGCYWWDSLLTTVRIYFEANIILKKNTLYKKNHIKFICQIQFFHLIQTKTKRKITKKYIMVANIIKKIKKENWFILLVEFDLFLCDRIKILRHNFVAQQSYGQHKPNYVLVFLE
jgi:hypothetical protein